MQGIFRLIRINLILRLLPLVIGLFAFVFSVGNLSLVLIAGSVVPIAAVYALSIWYERRGRITQKSIRTLLVLALVSQALESVFLTLILLVGIRQQSLPAEMVSRMQGQTGFSNLGASFLLSLLPCTLGAWVDGKRGAIKWSLLAVALNLLSLFIIGALDMLLDTRLGSLQSQLSSIAAYIIVTSVVCYFVGSLADQQREEHAQLERANKQLAEQTAVRSQLAANQERMRLSRDLHDMVAHTLGALSVQINAAGSVVTGDPEHAKLELDKARKLVREGLDSTRRAITDLRAHQVEDFGLTSALEKLAEGFTQRTAIGVMLDQQGAIADLNPEVANTVFRIAQEALNNVERHAHATQVKLHLLADVEASTVTLSIFDDGIGFAQTQLDDQRFGLKGMRERAELVGGHLRVDSAPGSGTTVSLVCPFTLTIMTTGLQVAG